MLKQKFTSGHRSFFAISLRWRAQALHSPQEVGDQVGAMDGVVVGTCVGAHAGPQSVQSVPNVQAGTVSHFPSLA
jgi:hypothetical protein